MSVKELIGQLKSEDATERLKAAAELGELGSADDAKHLIELIWNDPASPVQQIAVQAYASLKKNDAFSEVMRVIEEHIDEYVVLYAVGILGSLSADIVSEPLKKLITDDNEKIRTTALRSIIMAGLSDLSPLILELLENEEYTLAIQNGIEAMAIFRYKKSKKIIENIKKKYDADIEIRTISTFAMASFGDKKALDYLKNEEVDEYKRITINGNRYSGRKGLLLALKEI